MVCYLQWLCSFIIFRRGEKNFLVISLLHHYDHSPVLFSFTVLIPPLPSLAVIDPSEFLTQPSSIPAPISPPPFTHFPTRPHPQQALFYSPSPASIVPPPFPPTLPPTPPSFAPLSAQLTLCPPTSPASFVHAVLHSKHCPSKHSSASSSAESRASQSLYFQHLIQRQDVDTARFALLLFPQELFHFLLPVSSATFSSLRLVLGLSLSLTLCFVLCPFPRVYSSPGNIAPFPREPHRLQRVCSSHGLGPTGAFLRKSP